MEYFFDGFPLRTKWRFCYDFFDVNMVKTAGTIVKRAAQRWVSHRATTHGAALAFFAMLSLAPLLLISIAIISLVFGEEAAQGEMAEQLEALTGREAALTIQSLVDATSKSQKGSTATVVGLGMLLFGASAVFVQVQASLNSIWGMRETSGMGIVDFLRRRALSFAMTLGVGGVLMVSLMLSAWLAAAERMVGTLLPLEGDMPFDGLLDVWVDYALSLGLLTVLFALVFKLLPDTKIAWKDVWAGSAITAILFLVGKFFIGWYLGRGAVASAYGAAGSFVAVILWIYYSSLIFYFGAELTHAYASVVGSRCDMVEAADDEDCA